MVLATCVNLAMALANLLPLIRLDGYRVFCELLGVRDLLTMGAEVLHGRSRGPMSLETALAVFFTAITALAVPCLMITSVSMTLPGWTGLSVQTLATAMAITIGISTVAGIIATIIRRSRRQVRRA